jgi:hypothetical protein
VENSSALPAALNWLMNALPVVFNVPLLADCSGMTVGKSVE